MMTSPYIGGNMIMKKCCYMHIFRIAVGITMLVLLLAGGAGAVTITVNASGDGDYTRIQDSIDNASAGDMILVYSGIYLSSSGNNTLIGNNASSNNAYSGQYGNKLGTGIFLDSSSNNNKIYNNIFNNTNNVYFHSKINTWNTTRQSGTNIIGGSLLGGNFWANPKGKGFSQTCKDVNGDGICDSSRTLDANNIDYLPITKYKIPPKSVSKLKNVSYASAYINWTWTDPMDADFDKVKVTTHL